MRGLRILLAVAALASSGLQTAAIAQAPPAPEVPPFDPRPGQTCRPWQAIAAETNPARVNAAQTDAERRAAIQPMPSDADLATRMLAVHNELRASLGIPPLTWDADLARAAKAWAQRQVDQRTWLVHDVNVNESIVGSAGDAMWTVEEQANRWIAERENFQNAPIPQPMTRANPGYNLCWGSGHYQGMIRWTTYRVGCGIATSSDGLGRSLVCRYANAPIPAGMQDWPYPPGLPSSWPARPPIQPTAAELDDGENDLQATLGTVNNQYRASIGRPALRWNATLATAAQAQADRLIVLADPGTDPNPDGEWRGYSNPAAQAGVAPVYPPSAGTLRQTLENWGRTLHTTKPWTEMGCGSAARQVNNQNRRMVVCRYSPVS